MVEVKGEGDTATFHLKNRDVDYYIVGIHRPTPSLWSTALSDTEIEVYD